MEKKSRIFPALKNLALQSLINLTVKSLQNISDSNNIDKKEFILDRRKRSYSCNDISCVNENTNEKVSKVNNLAVIVAGKRKREDEVDAYVTKRRKYFNEGIVKSVPRRNNKNVLNYHSQDDISVNYIHKQPHDIIKIYLNFLPCDLWNAYSQELSTSLISTIYTGILGNGTVRQGLKLVLNNKISKLSTSKLKYFCTEVEGLIYDRLSFCRSLSMLDFTMVPENNDHIERLKRSLKYMLRLKYLSLISEEKYSFHWAFKTLSENCKKLVELKIVYDSDLFEEGNSILSLKGNNELEALWLFNTGRISETHSVKDLLNCLKSLKVLYHKELPNAILEYSEQEEYTKLFLKRIDLCWHQKGLGYQLVYVPSDYIIAVANVCPEIELLNLISPDCLLQLAERLPNLKALLIQQASMQKCLQGILDSNLGVKLTVLRVADVWDIDYDVISSIANGCPLLQVLSISSSVLGNRGTLKVPSFRSAFPFLREAIIIREELGDKTPLIKTADWKLGKALTMFLLRGSIKIAKLHLQYDRTELPEYDVLLENDLRYSLECCCNSLATFELLFPSQISQEFVPWLLDVCPMLTSLSDMRTWPINAQQRLQLIENYKSVLNIS